MNTTRTRAHWLTLMGVLAAFLPSVAASQNGYHLLRSCGSPDQAGTLPHAAPIFGSDGALYGTTQLGGAANQGTVFRIQPDGTGYSVLHSFSADGDGKHPLGALLQAQDGLLYGTTLYGGTNNCGTLFRLSADGATYEVVRHFSTNVLDCQYPYGRLIQDTNGLIFGAASTNKSGWGCIYRIQTNGNDFTFLHKFATNGVEGALPRSVILGQDGFLYGNTQRASKTNGCVFRLATDGTSFTVLTNLPGGSRRVYHNSLFQSADGTLYGTTCFTTNAEVLFRVGTSDGSYQVVHTFGADTADGLNPDTQLIQGYDGALYGTTMNGGTNAAGTVFRVDPDGSGYTILYSFGSSSVDGATPTDALVQGPDGRLYGTTLRGGANNEGTIFALNTNGTGYTLLRSFSSFAGGCAAPAGSLAEGDDGFLHGSAYSGGGSNGGTVFQIGLDGSNYITWHNFGGAGDGQQPSGKLLQAADGRWYGTTYTGGASNCGTIFRFNRDGSGYAILYSFTGPAGGETPSDALIQGTDQRLYGTAAAGGANGAGIVFAFDPASANLVVLHTFATNRTDGATPAGGLLLGTDGFLYGTTERGGSADAGTVYRLSQDGTVYSLLHTFLTNGADGTLPGAGLMLGRDGALYGTTQRGGTGGQGTVFKLNPDGSGYVVMRALDASGRAGREPSCQLVQDADGVLYGSAAYGGLTNTDGGVLFEMSTAGKGYQVLHSFGSGPSDGAHPGGAPLWIAGKGWCGVTEAGGDLDAGTIYLASGFPLSLVAQPVSQTNNPGTIARFAVLVEGLHANFRWRKNGVDLTDGEKTSGVLSDTLTLTNVLKPDEGEYSVVVTNLSGSLTSAVARLTVLDPPRIHTQDSFFGCSTNGFGFDFTGSAGSTAIVEGSFDLETWWPLQTNLIGTGPLFFRDATATNYPARFYRLRLGP